MLRPVPMTHLSLVVLERDQRKVLHSLGETGTMQFARQASGSTTAPLAPLGRVEELARCTRLQARIESLRHSLEIIVPTESLPQVVERTLDEAEREILAIEKRVGDLLKRRQDAVERQAKATRAYNQVSRFGDAAIPLVRPDRYPFLHFVVGTLPAQNLARLVREVSGSAVLAPLSENQGLQSVIAMTTRQRQTALEAALQNADFKREALPIVEGATTDSLAVDSRRLQEEASATLEELDAERRKLAGAYSRPLAELEEAVNVHRLLLNAEQTFPRTRAAVVIAGWVPADKASALEAHVRQITAERCAVERTAPGDSRADAPPVLLRDSWLLRPFQMLVTAYGLPNYRELEPTLFVAFSYMVMFGMMFGDMGHGAILSLGGLLVQLTRHRQRLRDSGLLLLFAGLSSAAFGWCYGSCFGLAAFRPHALWRDPLEGDPMTLMAIAIGVGIVMNSLGLALNVVNRFQRGDVVGGLLDKFGVAGGVFYWGALLLLTQFAALQSRGLLPMLMVLFVLLPATGWVLKGLLSYAAHRRAGQQAELDGGVLGVITESLVEAFEAVLSYLANTISFVRLAAYAMSHAALLAAAFMVAAELRRVPFGGEVMSAAAIVLGNGAALLLEGIIASVQALRLEYYEFFGKFYSGDGRPFEPFCLVADKRVSARRQWRRGGRAKSGGYAALAIGGATC